LSKFTRPDIINLIVKVFFSPSIQMPTAFNQEGYIMQTVLGTQYYDRPRFTTLRDLIRHVAEKYGDAPAYRYHLKLGDADTIKSFRTFAADIDAFGTGLVDLGVKNTHVVVIGDNSYEWAVAHNAVVNGIGVSVPLDRQLPGTEVISLTERGQAEVFIYGPRHHDLARAVAAVNSRVRFFISMKPGVITEKDKQADSRFIEFDDVQSKGARLLREGDRSFVDAIIDPEVMCSLLFTSGTTAMSKGVMLCHRNFAANVHSVASTIEIQAGWNALSVLPLHHTFENTVGMYMILSFGCCICFTDGLRYLAQNLKEWKINILLAVPLLFENIYSQIQRTLEKSGKLALVTKMRRIAAGLRHVGIDVRRKLFAQILEAVGGGLNLCVCGAAAIDGEITQFFNEIGIDFWSGYGLTETSPVISACNKKVNIYGSVGNPLAFIEVAIDTESKEPGANGEILTRSESVMLGYYQNEAATAEIMTADGYLRTGDIGYLDKKGCIHITGRAKSMIVLTNGKKAFPEEIEFLIARIPGVKESIVWGDTNTREAVDICAKIVVDRTRLPEEAGTDNELINQFFAGQIRAINQQMPPYKAIKYFILTENDLIKTTTLKVRRPLENEAIHAYLNSNNLIMKTANGRFID
jgi:long-chain acyl-CoA synthetase